jgi:flagellar protein FlaG
MSNNISSVPSTPVAAPAPAAPKVAPAEPKAEAVQANLPGAKAAPVPDLKPAFDAKEAQDRLNEAVERMNEHMRKNAYNLAFSVDKEADKVVVKVKNLETGDVVRQIPNETALRIAHNIEDMRGLLQDKKI